MELIVFLAFIYLFTMVAGIGLERNHIPWIFAALILGVLLAASGRTELALGETFVFAARIGMFLMLFLIGYEIDLPALLDRGTSIVRATFFIILLEGVLGSLLIHVVFGYGWLIAVLVAVSFATVGEAMLLPILDEFDLLKTDLGQMIVGIGVIDDAIELVVIITASIVLGSAAGNAHVNTGLTIAALGALFVMAYGLTRLAEEGRRLEVLDIEDIFLFVVFVFFLFVAVGQLAEAGALGAVLAGVAVRNFLPADRVEGIESDLKSIAYGLFGPLFFVWVGAETNISYLFANPLLVLLVIAVTKAAKIMGSWLVAHREFGTKRSVFIGVALSVRFSTSIVIITLLHDAGVIMDGLFSVLVASTILFKFLVPFLLSQMATRWDVGDPQV